MKTEMKKNAKKFSVKELLFPDASKARRGSMSTAMIAVGIAIVIIFNIVCGLLPSSWSEIDVSSDSFYDISDTTLDLLNNLQDDITIVGLVQDDSLNEMISTFLDKYCALSDHLSWSTIDPVKHPTAPSEYGAEEGDFIITDTVTGQSTIVSDSDIVISDYSNYYYDGSVSYSFDGEGQLTSAINRLTNGASKVIYTVTGHGESDLSDSVVSMLEKSQLDVESLNLLTAGEIPEDCDQLIINAPSVDFTADEVSLLSDYLAQGGYVTVLIGNDDGCFNLTNLYGLLAEYGMEVQDGYIGEDTQGYYYQNLGNFCLVPVIETVTGVTSDLRSDAYAVIYSSQGMAQVDPVRDTITVSPFMTSSENAFVYTETSDTDDMVRGTFLFGAVATEDIDDTTTARLTVFANSYMLADDITSYFPGAENTTIFVNAVTAGYDDIENLSIPVKSLDTQYNTFTNWLLPAAVIVILIPLALIIVGVVIWARRRKR